MDEFVSPSSVRDGERRAKKIISLDGPEGELVHSVDLKFRSSHILDTITINNH